jgi:hypothetical protein
MIKCYEHYFNANTVDLIEVKRNDPEKLSFEVHFNLKSEKHAILPFGYFSDENSLMDGLSKFLTLLAAKTYPVEEMLCANENIVIADFFRG